MGTPEFPDICEDAVVTAALDAARKKWDRIDDAYAGLQWNIVRHFDSGKPVHTRDGPMFLFKRGAGREVEEAPIFRALCVREGETKIVVRHLDVVFPEDW